MSHEFEIREQIELDATPEQVWDAIATGPGLTSWFVGRHEVEPREGGTAKMILAGHTEESTVTAWEEGRRIATQSPEGPDGSFMALEFLVEGREGGSTVLRYVHSGVMTGDWESEYDAVRKGTFMYLRKLTGYLRHFAGRTASYDMFVPGPPVHGDERVWSAFLAAAGISGEAAEGEKARLTVEGVEPVDGVVHLAEYPTFLSVRTEDGVYTFIHGYQDAVVVEHENFSGGAGADKEEPAWQSWINSL